VGVLWDCFKSKAILFPILCIVNPVRRVKSAYAKNFDLGWASSQLKNPKAQTNTEGEYDEVCDNEAVGR